MELLRNAKEVDLKGNDCLPVFLFLSFKKRLVDIDFAPSLAQICSSFSPSANVSVTTAESAVSIRTLVRDIREAGRGLLNGTCHHHCSQELQ